MPTKVTSTYLQEIKRSGMLGMPLGEKGSAIFHDKQELSARVWPGPERVGAVHLRGARAGTPPFSKFPASMAMIESHYILGRLRSSADWRGFDKAEAHLLLALAKGHPEGI